MRTVLLLLACAAAAFGQINLNSPVPMERDDHAKAATPRRAAPKATASEATETPWTWDGESWTRMIRVKKVATARSVPQSPFTQSSTILTTPATVAVPANTLYPVGIPTERTRTRALGAGIGGGIRIGRFGASVGGCVGGG